jgi:hypothetical protein
MGGSAASLGTHGYLMAAVEAISLGAFDREEQI